MTSFLRQFSTLSLLTCLLFLNSLALPQVVTHTLHHAKHTADTHSSPVCFWLCVAGQMEEAPGLPSPQGSYPLGTIETPLLPPYSAYHTPARHARAPPL